MNEYVARYNLNDDAGDRTKRFQADSIDEALHAFRRMVPVFKRRPCTPLDRPHHRSALYEFDGPRKSWAEVWEI